MIVGECITALLFPFVWPHVYAPILPAALHHFLDAPVPFVMGLHADSESYLKIGNEASLCCVDIDKNNIQLPEELPEFPHRMDFMAEISAALDKFNVIREKQLDQTTILSPKNFLMQRPNLPNDVMTSSCTLPSGLHVRRKHSLHDILDWDRPNTPPTDAVYLSQQSNGLHINSGMVSGGGGGGSGVSHPSSLRISDIMRRSAYTLNGIDCSTDVMPTTRKGLLTRHEQYCEDLRLNNSVREIFLNRFVQIFASYENFVILPNQSKEEWLTQRESLHSFDKASFLSDQQQHHRPFLSRFLESQMFATLIDNKILSMWDDDVDANLKLFDNRIKILK